MTTSRLDKNHLADAASPYLKQHRDNPVHWQIWSEETLALARKYNRPILLSIGYAACHWCHVMAHESFENPDIASLMNRLFVNVKVDREERPDIDQIYMNALHAMGEQGGWPLTMFLTPQGEPFWGGTYFPPEDAYGRPGFPRVLTTIAELYENKPDLVKSNSQAILTHLEKQASAPTDSQTLPKPELVKTHLARTLELHDPLHGGIRGAPKFPNAPILDTWLRGAKTDPESPAGEAFIRTMTKLSEGGIYDHLGGGLARYSVDERWLAPHFEKMLYDNAHFIRHATFAWQLTSQALFRQRIEETIEWLDREMRLAGGAFASSLDADSEGEEGKFYIWQSQEIKTILGDAYDEFAHFYDVADPGNWEDKTILNRLTAPPADEQTEARLAHSRDLLLEGRNDRIRPGLDDKILTDWNGYMIEAIAYAGDIFKKSDWIKLAENAFNFVSESEGGLSTGKLPHAVSTKGTPIAGLSSDYAAMANAALQLYQTTANSSYLDFARAWLDTLHTEFTDGNGGYFLTQVDQADLLIRPRCDTDDPNPSPASQILHALVRLSHFQNDMELHKRAENLARSLYSVSESNPYGLTGAINAFDRFFNHVHVLIIAEDQAAAEPFRQAALAMANPDLSVAISAGGNPVSHLGQEIRSTGTKTSAIVCTGQQCSAPLSKPKKLTEYLNTPVRK